MSKPVKEMIVADYQQRVSGYDDALVVSLRGLDAGQTTEVRGKLREKQISVQVVKNSLARKAFEGSGLSGLAPVLTGSSAVVYGAESVVEVAREIVDLVKTFPDMELKGAVLDGDLYEGEDGVKRLSKFPTREEAIAQTVTLVLGPARKLVASVKGPGSNLAGIVKAIEEKLEKGEEIAKVS